MRIKAMFLCIISVLFLVVPIFGYCSNSFIINNKTLVVNLTEFNNLVSVKTGKPYTVISKDGVIQKVTKYQSNSLESDIHATTINGTTYYNNNTTDYDGNHLIESVTIDTSTIGKTIYINSINIAFNKQIFDYLVAKYNIKLNSMSVNFNKKTLIQLFAIKDTNVSYKNLQVYYSNSRKYINSSINSN